MRLILLVFSVFQKVTRHKGRESAFGCRGGTLQSLSTTGTQHSRTKGHTAVAMVNLCPDSASAVDSHWQEPSAGTYNARPINHSKTPKLVVCTSEHELACPIRDYYFEAAVQSLTFRGASTCTGRNHAAIPNAAAIHHLDCASCRKTIQATL